MFTISALNFLFMEKCFSATRRNPSTIKATGVEEIEDVFLKHFKLRSKYIDPDSYINFIYNSIFEKFECYKLEEYFNKNFFEKINSDISYDYDFSGKCFEKQIKNKFKDNLDFYSNMKFKEFSNGFNYEDKYQNPMANFYVLCDDYKTKTELCFLPFDYSAELFMEYSRRIFGDILTSNKPLSYYNLSENNFLLFSLLRFIIKNVKEMQKSLDFGENDSLVFDSEKFLSAYNDYSGASAMLFKTLGMDEFMLYFEESTIVKFFNSYVFLNKMIKFFYAVFEKNDDYKYVYDNFVLCNIARIISMIKYDILLEDDVIQSIENEILNQRNSSLASKFYNNVLAMLNKGPEARYKSSSLDKVKPISEELIAKVSKCLVEKVIERGNFYEDDEESVSYEYSDEEEEYDEEEEESKTDPKTKKVYENVFNYDKEGKPIMSTYDFSSHKKESEETIPFKNFSQEDSDDLKAMIETLDRGYTRRENPELEQTIALDQSHQIWLNLLLKIFITL